MLRDGDELIKGGNMIYFQPETMLSDLGRDGSSSVRSASLIIIILSHHLGRLAIPVQVGV